MTSKTILIYDDDQRRAGRWREMLAELPVLRRNYVIDVLPNAEFDKEIADLQTRRKRARRSSGRSWSGGSNRLDTVDILVIDYDLLNAGAVTGEEAAYLARCYSRCGIIVALNQFGRNSFDLTLKGHPESYADVNIGSEQLDNPGLWTGEWSSFRPWAWPLLPHALDAFKRRLESVRGHLDSVLVQFLGLPDSTTRTLPRWATAFLATKKLPDVVSFREFVISSGNGFRHKDRPPDDDAVARVAAARIAHWLEQFLLPGQDILVDAPHLVYRYPSLLKGDRGNVSVWNKTAALSEPSRVGIRHQQIARHLFRSADWLSRPAWLWSEVGKDHSIMEVADPWSTDRPNWVFCEDTSRFHHPREAREFVADVPSPFVRRFVINPRHVQKQTLKASLRQVDYRPRDRLFR